MASFSTDYAHQSPTEEMAGLSLGGPPSPVGSYSSGGGGGGGYLPQSPSMAYGGGVQRQPSYSTQPQSQYQQQQQQNEWVSAPQRVMPANKLVELLACVDNLQAVTWRSRVVHACWLSTVVGLAAWFDFAVASASLMC